MDPAEEYKTRLTHWLAKQAAVDRQFRTIGNWRLVIGIVEASLACLVFGPHWIGPWALIPLLIPFAALIIWHYRLVPQKTRAQRTIAFYEGGLARLENRWMGRGSGGERFRDANHVYSNDLDVFGSGSLFELINTARTAAGEELIADWLKAPASRSEVMARQEAVRELAWLLDFRGQISTLSEDVRVELHLDDLEKWGAKPAAPFSGALRLLALGLALLGIPALMSFLAGVFFAGISPIWPLLVIFLADLAFIGAVRRRVRELPHFDTPAVALQLLAALLKCLEARHFEAPLLQQLRSNLKVHGVPASRRIKRLQVWVDLLDSSDHLLIRAIRPILLWQEQVAMGIEAWRCENGPQIGKWVRAVAEFEALSSLATLVFERPDWPFPVLVEDGGACFEAVGLKHPLLANCVSNDVALNNDLRLLIVSGSNMSGKSTLLRSVGLNSALAWAGGPVTATSLQVSQLQVAASLRIVDSLQDHVSRFMAEILRLRQIVELTGADLPVLFLLDELLSGTNSHDRRIGAAGIVKKLVNSYAIGLITTHDLALAGISEELGNLAMNVHFDDQILNGHIEFDYKLKPGTVTRSNALELMRSVGLEV